MKIQKNDIKEELKSIMREESDYKTFFKKSLKAAGKSIPDMTDSEKKAFFDKIDKAWNAKGEKNENSLYQNESETKAIDLLLKNKGMKDAIKNEKVSVIRTALEDEGFNTKGISDKDILTLSKNLQNESINEIEYKDAISNFNKELEKNPSVKKIASHYKKPTKSIVKALQPMLTVLRYKDKSIKSVSIDFTDAASGPTKVKLSKTYTQNESTINEASKADTIRKSMPGYVGPKFAKKASDEDILAMADLKDEKAKIHNRYMKAIDDKIKKLQKKYKVNESIKESINEENNRFNKWLLKLIDNYMEGSEKPGTPEYQWVIKTLFQHTLHDANFHSEAKKVEKIFRRAKEPNKAEQLDRLLLNKAEDIAAKAKWDGHDIIDGFAYVSAMRIGGPKLKPIKALKNESVNLSENFTSDEIDKIKGVVEDSKSFMNIGRGLKKAGFKYDFSTEPIPLYMIKSGSKKFVLVNKQYADKPKFVVGSTAGGLLEGNTNESSSTKSCGCNKGTK